MPHETVTLVLNRGGEVSLSDFAAAVAHFDALIKALSRSLAGKDAGVDWRVERLAVGSAVVEVRSEHDRAPDVADSCLQVVRALGREESLSYGKLVARPAKDLLGMLGHGVEELRFETLRGEAVLQGNEPTRLAGRAPTVALGAVEGTVEMISSHGGIRFNLYEPLFNRRVACHASDDHIDALRSLWRERVVVEGKVTRDPEGHPVSITAITDVRPVTVTEPGAWRRSVGAIPARPGSPPPEVLIRRMRDAN